MLSVSALLDNFKKLLKDNIWRAALLSILIIIYSTLSEFFIENPIANSGIHSIFESLWWTMQTVTTVGYGDVTIVGFYGKTNAMIVMIFGIGSFSFLLVSIAAEILDAAILKRIGGRMTRMKNHIIVCNYGSNGTDVIESLLKEKDSLVYLGSTKPSLENDKLDFVNGSALEESDLLKAGIEKATKIVIFPDEKSSGKNSNAVDAESILSAMNIRRLNPNVFIIIELMNEKNSSHAKAAGINEIIVRGKLSSYLIIKSINEGNVGKFIQKLLEPKGKIEIEELSVDKSGSTFEEIYRTIESSGRRVIAISENGQFRNRPDGNETYHGEVMLALNIKTE
ncbi:MAG: potassium channel family protein [Thermoplasmataceae archaeon]